MNRMLNQMTQRAQLADKKVVCTYGIVSSYDPDNYCCKVMLQPSGLESGWLPILSPFIGNQWGIFAPPTQGDMVVVLHIEGSLDAGAVVSGQYNNDRRPVRCESGVLYLVHKSGSSLRFNNDGTVILTASDALNVHAAEVSITCDTLDVHATEANITCDVNITGDVKITGDTTVTGSVSDNKGTMQAMRDVFDTHTQAVSGGVAHAPTGKM